MEKAGVRDSVSDRESLFGGRVPIVIGVTGHRAFGDAEAAIERTVTAELQTLKTRYPRTPFVVLSSLAEGADRLVARIAMDELGAKLFAILPLPPDEYMKDFATEGSRRNFKALLESAIGIIEVFQTEDRHLWSETGESRNEQYAKAGGVVSEQSQILLAIWDGKPARGTGGTAHVVDWFRQGYPPRQYSGFPRDISPLDPAEPGYLIHIDAVTGKRMPTRGPDTTLFGRSEGSAPRNGGKSLTSARRSDIRQILGRTERYNREVASYKGAPIGKWPLLPAGVKASAIPADAAATYLASDGLAVSLSTRVRGLDEIFYAAALVAVFFFNMLNNWPLASGVYLALISVIFAGTHFSRALSLDDRFLEYRGLAEAMRVLFFWRLCGIGKPVWLCYLSKHSGVVHWVRHAVRALEFCEGRHRSQVPENAIELTKAHWVEDQVVYYEKASARLMLHYERWITLATLAFWSSFLLSLVFLALSLASRKNMWEWSEAGLPFPLAGGVKTSDFVDWLQVALGLLAAVGLAVRAFLMRRADLEHAQQFAATRQTFEIALESLENAKKKTGKLDWTREEILEKLGREALLEQAEWLWIRHSRPFEIPN